MNDSTMLHDISPPNAEALASKEGFAQDPRSVEDNSHLVSSRLDESTLPPVDGGKDAWLFLAACFVVEALVWGTSLATLPGYHHDTHTTQASPSPTVSSRNTIPPMSPSKVPATSPS